MKQHSLPFTGRGEDKISSIEIKIRISPHFESMQNYRTKYFNFALSFLKYFK
jgi:hypothetical protein